MQSRNNMISIWRIVFTYMIVCFHFFSRYGIKTDWEIAVDFFFIVSGWLLAQSENKYKVSAYRYTWNRIKRLYPEYLPAFLINVLCVFLLGQYSLKEFVWWIKGTGIRELLLIHYWPWNEGHILANAVTWYLSVMLVAGLILYSLYNKYPNLLKEIILPIVIISFLTYTFRKYYDFMGDDIVGVFHMRFFRGFTDMGIGLLLYELSEHCSRYIKRKIFAIIGLITMSFVIVASYFSGGTNNYLYLLMISGGVFLSFNSSIKANSLLRYWEKTCYSIFLNHNLFYSWIFPRAFKTYSIWALIIYIVCVTFFSCVIYQLVTLLYSIMCKNVKAFLLRVYE